MLNAAWETVTNGLSPWTLRNRPDWSSLEKLADYAAPERDWGQRELPPRDRLQGVYFAATAHDDDQPVHLVVHDTSICADRCAVEYGIPCTTFCPACVYEMVDDPSPPHGLRLKVNTANLLTSKLCHFKPPSETPTQSTYHS